MRDHSNVKALLSVGFQLATIMLHCRDDECTHAVALAVRVQS